MRIPPLLAITAMLACSSSAKAALSIYESFSQTPGVLDGAVGGTGLGTWSSPTGELISSPSGLTYVDLPNAGGVVNGTNASGSGARGNVTTTSALFDDGLLDDGATLWFSVVTTGATGSNQHSGFGFGTTAVAGAFNGLNMGSNGVGNGIGFYTRQGNVQAIGWNGAARSTLGSGLSTPAGSTNLVVGRVVWGAGAAAETLTIFRPSLTGLAQPVTGSTTTIDGFDQTLLNTISFASRSGVQSWDEIRFGASYDDVIGVAPVAPAIPEPTAGMLGAIGSLMLLRRRR